MDTEFAVYFEPEDLAAIVAKLENFILSGECQEEFLPDAASALAKLKDCGNA